jgi:hypothetical protein
VQLLVHAPLLSSIILYIGYVQSLYITFCKLL